MRWQAEGRLTRLVTAASRGARSHFVQDALRADTEIKRRTNDVGFVGKKAPHAVFRSSSLSNREAVVRRVGALVPEQNDVYGPPRLCKRFPRQWGYRCLQSCIRPVCAASPPLALMVSAVRRPDKWTSSRRLTSFHGPLPNPGCPGLPSSLASLASQRRVLSGADLCQAAASNTAGCRYVSSRRIMAQSARAVLCATATAATLTGRRPINA